MNQTLLTHLQHRTMPRKKKEQLFQVEQATQAGTDNSSWVRMKGQFASKAEATEWMNEKVSHGGRNPKYFRVVKEG
mgnify:CR=1 FL=1